MKHHEGALHPGRKEHLKLSFSEINISNLAYVLEHLETDIFLEFVQVAFEISVANTWWNVWILSQEQWEIWLANTKTFRDEKHITYTTLPKLTYNYLPTFLLLSSILKQIVPLSYRLHVMHQGNPKVFAGNTALIDPSVYNRAQYKGSYKK